MAVFVSEQQDADGRRERVAINLATGAQQESVPDRESEPFVEFSWSDPGVIRALRSWQPMSKQAMQRRFSVPIAPPMTWTNFAGISYGGRVVPLDLKLHTQHYLAAAQARDGYVGFRLRESPVRVPSPLWLLPVDEPGKITCIDAPVIDFALLDKGHAVVATGGQGRQGDSAEAFYVGDASHWNILAGVERLPPLEEPIAQRRSIRDKMDVRLVAGFGGDSGPLVLCIFRHGRVDFDSRPNLGVDRLEPANWQRTMLIGPGEERYTTDLFRDRIPEKVWLHNSGKVITADRVENNPRFRLREITLGIPAETQ